MSKFFRPGDEREILAAKWELEFEETFHFKNFYKLAHEFLFEQGWRDPEDGGENWEFLYFDRTVPPSGVREHRIWWRVAYIPNGSKYMRYMMKLDFLTLVMRKSEVVMNGTKYSTWAGDVILRVESWIQLDYMNKWQKHPFLKHFDKFFRDRIYKKYWEAHKKELYNMSYDLNRELKHYLKLKTPVKTPRTFRAEKGVPS